MKLLYLSCHSILEFDELRMFSELGIDVFSHGAYHNPQVLDDKKRPPLNLKYHRKFSETTIVFSKENLLPELCQWADVVICMHVVDWLIKNWEKIRKKRVILRTIGQSTIDTENLISQLRKDGLEIVRYSPREKTIPNYQGEDALIRFAKYPEDFGPWTGEIRQVITVAQSMKHRDHFCNWSVFDKATSGYPRKVYGPENEVLGPDFGGLLSYDELRDVLRKSLVYFYTGTYPASYTLNFIEAAMSGLPMVALGDLLGNSPDHLEQQTYEVADLLRRYEAGLTGDTIDKLRENVQVLFDDEGLRKKYSRNIREMALDLFDAYKIKEQWRKFLFS